MSSISVHRASEWQDKLRAYSVLIDGVKRGQIASGAAASFEVGPGRHVVLLKVDWCRSPPLEIQVAEGESRRLACGPNSHPLLSIFNVIFRSGNYIWLREAAAGQPNPDA